MQARKTGRRRGEEKTRREKERERGREEGKRGRKTARRRGRERKNARQRGKGSHGQPEKRRDCRISAAPLVRQPGVGLGVISAPRGTGQHPAGGLPGSRRRRPAQPFRRAGFAREEKGKVSPQPSHAHGELASPPAALPAPPLARRCSGCYCYCCRRRRRRFLASSFHKAEAGRRSTWLICFS